MFQRTTPSCSLRTGGSHTGSQRYTLKFKQELARQIIVRGYTARDVSQQLGVSAHSLYKWGNTVKPEKSEQHHKYFAQAKSEKLRVQLRKVI